MFIILRMMMSVKPLSLRQRLPKSEPHVPPLDTFGADAVDRWFTEKEITDVVSFTNRLSA
jgi:hypothetical protein